jgi:hypothetical protein
MKERIVQKLNERIEKILAKDELSPEDYSILQMELMHIEMRELRAASALTGGGLLGTKPN